MNKFVGAALALTPLTHCFAQRSLSPDDRLKAVVWAIDERINRYHDSTLIDLCSVYRLVEKDRQVLSGLPSRLDPMFAGASSPNCAPLTPQKGIPRRIIVDSVFVTETQRIVAMHYIEDRNSYSIEYRFSPNGGAMEVRFFNLYNFQLETKAPYKPPLGL